MTPIRAYAALEAGGPLQTFSYDPGPLGEDEVKIRVEHCGICHSDLAMIDSEWFPASYPIVPGHEVVGVITALGSHAKGRQIGQRVGIGWHTSSCTHCQSCLGGEQNLCAKRQPTIMGRHGGFAESLRAHWSWAVPIPDGLDPASAGPLMCGGGTVFLPFVIHSVKPTDRVGVVGIGGLGHLAVKFARAWGCEVTAFTSSPSKREEALALGAHKTVSSVDLRELKAAAGSLDFLLITVGASLEWDALINTLAPKGRMHLVGVVTDKMSLRSGSLLSWQRGLSASPTPSPTVLAKMLEFSARHGIAPQVERFAMSRVNEAVDHLRSGKARYRVVLDADF
ncbi:MAG: NAD(P)-dependent alcohol dehydrogenase [Burkholderiaceae bacterium]|nr:NAD(P)-dependent alcohol dehydrogenase [Burkholderiaceae bacterium]